MVPGTNNVDIVIDWVMNVITDTTIDWVMFRQGQEKQNAMK